MSDCRERKSEKNVEEDGLIYLNLFSSSWFYNKTLLSTGLNVLEIKS